jgi:hypothetical protein
MNYLMRKPSEVPLWAWGIDTPTKLA